MSFSTLQLHPKILEAITEAGYVEPTTIQLKAIPKILSGFDIRASAQTGTGKTAAFLLPALTKILTNPSKPAKGPRILILVPTRELAQQIESQARKYTSKLPLIKTVCVVGGIPYPIQRKKMEKPYDLLIATPGRLIDFMQQGTISFGRLETLVLDEADRMLDMGFIEPIEEIVAATPKTRQTLLFSATLKGAVIKLSEKLLNKPMEIVAHSEVTMPGQIDQKLHYVDNIGHKNRLLEHFLSLDETQSTIVFTSTKRNADQIAHDLKEKNYRSAALHGDLSQRQRTRTLGMLREGKINVLIATDVAARGLDVGSVGRVINFDLPKSAEDYVHRIGRTGRAGAKGTAFSFADNRDKHLVKKIEEYTGHKIPLEEVPGLEPTNKFKGDNDRPKKGREERGRRRGPPVFARSNKKRPSTKKKSNAFAGDSKRRSRY